MRCAQNNKNNGFFTELVLVQAGSCFGAYVVGGDQVSRVTCPACSSASWRKTSSAGITRDFGKYNCFSKFCIKQSMRVCRFKSLSFKEQQKMSALFAQIIGYLRRKLGGRRRGPRVASGEWSLCPYKLKPSLWYNFFSQGGSAVQIQRVCTVLN